MSDTIPCDYKTWPYGTIKPCLVKEVIRQPPAMAIICEVDGEPGQLYVCVYKDGFVDAEEGRRGRLVFSRGGPTGGFWAYQPDAQANNEVTR